MKFCSQFVASYSCLYISQRITKLNVNGKQNKGYCMWDGEHFIATVIFCLFSYLYRTQFKIPQGVNAFDYSERINLIGKLDVNIFTCLK